ncbi:MAG: hypothetical protein RL186_1199 [Pseudomonadota bacterium]|jgi:hypothetical protein
MDHPHQSRLRGTVSPAHAAPGAQGRRGVAVPCGAGADGGIRIGRAGGVGVDILTFLLIDNMFDVSIGYDVSKCRG